MVNITNPNQALYFAIAVLPIQIISVQQQHMFALFILYSTWINEFRAVLNIACLRKRRGLRIRHAAPNSYAWTIPRHTLQLLSSYSTGILSAAFTGKQGREGCSRLNKIPADSKNGFFCFLAFFQNLPAPPIHNGVFEVFPEFLFFCFYPRQILLAVRVKICPLRPYLRFLTSAFVFLLLANEVAHDNY